MTAAQHYPVTYLKDERAAELHDDSLATIWPTTHRRSIMPASAWRNFTREPMVDSSEDLSADATCGNPGTTETCQSFEDKAGSHPPLFKCTSLLYHRLMTSSDNQQKCLRSLSAATAAVGAGAVVFNFTREEYEVFCRRPCWAT